MKQPPSIPKSIKHRRQLSQATLKLKKDKDMYGLLKMAAPLKKRLHHT